MGKVHMWHDAKFVCSQKKKKVKVNLARAKLHVIQTGFNTAYAE